MLYRLIKLISAYYSLELGLGILGKCLEIVDIVLTFKECKYSEVMELTYREEKK